MRRAAWLLLIGAVVLVTLTAMAVAAFLVWGLPQELGTVTINGETIDLRGAHAGHWAIATLGILLATAIVMLVVPLVMVIALVAPLLVAALGMLLGAVAVGLVLSPLLLLGVWLWSRSRKKTTIGA